MLTGDSGDLLRGREAVAFERTIAPAFLAQRRWFAGRNEGVRQVTAETLGKIEAGKAARAYLLTRLSVVPKFGGPQTYFAPLAINEAEESESVLPYAVARVRRGARIGLLYDADADPHFGAAMAGNMKAGAQLPAREGGVLQFHGADALKDIALEDMESTRLGGDQSNSTLVIGEEAVLKIYRRAQSGANPEVEMSRYLTEVAHFEGTPAYLGSLTHVSAEGVATPLAILQRYVRNQGDGWTRTLDAFRLALEELVTPPPGQAPSIEEAFSGFLPRAEALGRRTGELHRALATASGAADFAPESMTPADLAAAAEDMRRQATRARDALRRLPEEMTEARAALVADFLGAEERLEATIARLTRDPVKAMKIRVHGDYHLGQVLIVQTDVVIVDFEGEPSRPAEERRAKDTPLRDVAGMLRSISYAGESAILAVEQRLSTDPSRAERIAAEGVRLVSDVFMKAYAAEVGGSPAEVADAESFDRLLRIKLLAKALYEINYEAEFRPAWISVPIKGALALLSEMEGTQ